MQRLSKLFLSTIILLGLTAGLASAAPPAGKGKPGGGGDPPPPPPVTYALKVYDMPTAGDLNVSSYKMTSTGVVVGYYQSLNGVYQPFIYDGSSDPLPDTAIHLDSLGVVGLPEGWRIAAILDINSYGIVVGAIEEISNPGVWRGYLLDLGVDPPQLTTLPDGPGHAYARGINDDMDIVGVSVAGNGAYRGYVYNPLWDAQDPPQVTDLGVELLDNHIELSKPLPGFPAQVVGLRASDAVIFRYTIESGETNPLFQIIRDSRERPYDISSTGVVCGSYPIPKTKNGFMAYRYDTSLETLPNLGPAVAINAHGDLAGARDRTLYHEGTGLIDLTQTLTGSPDDLTLWNNRYSTVTVSDITERGALNPDVPSFPGLCGTIREFAVTTRGFVLIPVAQQ